MGTAAITMMLTCPGGSMQCSFCFMRILKAGAASGRNLQGDSPAAGVIHVPISRASKSQDRSASRLECVRVC